MVFPILGSPDVDDIVVEIIPGTPPPKKEEEKKDSKAKKEQGDPIDETPVDGFGVPETPSNNGPIRSNVERKPYAPTNPGLFNRDQGGYQFEKLFTNKPEDLNDPVSVFGIPLFPYFRLGARANWGSQSLGSSTGSILTRYGSGNTLDTFGTTELSIADSSTYGIEFLAGHDVSGTNLAFEFAFSPAYVSGNLEPIHNPASELPRSPFDTSPEPSTSLNGKISGTKAEFDLNTRYNWEYASILGRASYGIFDYDVSGLTVPVNEQELSGEANTQNGRPITNLSGQELGLGLGLSLHLDETSITPIELTLIAQAIWNINTEVTFGAPSGTDYASATRELDHDSALPSGYRIGIEGRFGITDTQKNYEGLYETREKCSALITLMLDHQKHIKEVDKQYRIFRDPSSSPDQKDAAFAAADRAFKRVQSTQTKIQEKRTDLINHVESSRGRFSSDVYDRFNRDEYITFSQSKWVVETRPKLAGYIRKMAEDLDQPLPSSMPVTRATPQPIDINSTAARSVSILGLNPDQLDIDKQGQYVVKTFANPFNGPNVNNSPIYTREFTPVLAENLVLPKGSLLASTIQNSTLDNLEENLGLYLSKEEAKKFIDLVRSIKSELDSSSDKRINISLSKAKYFTEYSGTLNKTLGNKFLLKGALVQLLGQNAGNRINITDGKNTEIPNGHISIQIGDKQTIIDLGSKEKKVKSTKDSLEKGVLIPFQNANGAAFVLKVSDGNNIEVLKYTYDEASKTSGTEPLSDTDQDKLVKDLSFEKVFGSSSR